MLYELLRASRVTNYTPPPLSGIDTLVSNFAHQRPRRRWCGSYGVLRISLVVAVQVTIKPGIAEGMGSTPHLHDADRRA